MLSDIEITYFRSRVDGVLTDGRPTALQRQFLADVRAKIDRYGTKTRLTEKQLVMLKRLTKLEGAPIDRSSVYVRPPHCHSTAPIADLARSKPRLAISRD